MPTDDTNIAPADAVLRQLVEQAPIAMQLFATGGTIELVNRAWETLWQVSREEIGDYNLFDDPQLADTGIPAFRRALAGESVVLTDYFYDPALANKKGRPRWLRTHLFPTRDQHGAITHIAVIHLDITAEVQARQQYQSMVDNAQEAVLVTQDGRIQFANDKLFDYISYSREEITSRPLLNFLHPDDRAAIAKRYQARLRGDAIPPHFQVRFIDKDDSVQWLEGNSSKIDWQGRPAILSLFTNVTRRRQIEKRLRESERRFRTIAENSTNIVFSCRTDGTLLYCNPATVDLLDTPLGDLLGASLFTLYHPDDRQQLQSDIERLLGNGQPAARRIRLCKKGGSFLPAESTLFTYIDDDNQAVIGGIIRDLSQRLEKEQLLAQKLDALGLLAGGIAHDFNNLLMAMSGNLSLMRLQQTDNSPLLENIAEMERACQRAMALTGQMLTFTKGGAPIKKSARIDDILRDSSSFVLRGSACDCHYAFADDLWLAELDPGQISQVIQNLVINAIHAMPRGGTITIQAENLWLSHQEDPLLPDGPYLSVTVSDQGIGIPSEYLDDIFDPYFSTKESGSGLGLAAAYSIIRRHQGKISVASTPGQGTTFTLLLPALPDATADAPMVQPQLRGGQGIILLMDDEEAVRAVAAAMLKKLGYTVLQAADGEAALHRVEQLLERQQTIAAAILDLTIPGGMGGRECAARLRELIPEVPLIATSGYTHEDVMGNYRQYGFAAILPKPYDLPLLDGVVAELTTAP